MLKQANPNFQPIMGDEQDDNNDNIVAARPLSREASKRSLHPVYEDKVAQNQDHESGMWPPEQININDCRYISALSLDSMALDLDVVEREGHEAPPCRPRRKRSKEGVGAYSKGRASWSSKGSMDITFRTLVSVSELSLDLSGLDLDYGGGGRTNGRSSMETTTIDNKHTLAAPSCQANRKVSKEMKPLSHILPPCLPNRQISNDKEIHLLRDISPPCQPSRQISNSKEEMLFKHISPPSRPRRQISNGKPQVKSFSGMAPPSRPNRQVSAGKKEPSHQSPQDQPRLLEDFNSNGKYSCEPELPRRQPTKLPDDADVISRTIQANFDGPQLTQFTTFHGPKLPHRQPTALPAACSKDIVVVSPPDARGPEPPRRQPTQLPLDGFGSEKLNQEIPHHGPAVAPSYADGSGTSRKWSITSHNNNALLLTRLADSGDLGGKLSDEPSQEPHLPGRQQTTLSDYSTNRTFSGQFAPSHEPSFELSEIMGQRNTSSKTESLDEYGVSALTFSYGDSDPNLNDDESDLLSADEKRMSFLSGICLEGEL